MAMNCENAQAWLQEALDGELAVLQRAPLRAHLEDCADCRAAARRLEALAAMLAHDTVEVPADFSQTVMARLPAAAWEVRRPRAWVAAAAALLVVLLAAAGLGLAAGELPGLGAVGAFGDLLAESIIAGAGLAGASWRGLWLAVAELRQAEPWIPFAVGLLAVTLCILLWRLARGRRVAPQRSTHSRPSS